MDKARELLDRFFGTPNIALIVFVVITLSLFLSIVVFGAHPAKPMVHATQHAPRNLPDGNMHLLR
jgi:F0F1-type ATP synthase assembly protein I